MLTLLFKKLFPIYLSLKYAYHNILLSHVRWTCGPPLQQQFEFWFWHIFTERSRQIYFQPIKQHIKVKVAEARNRLCWKRPLFKNKMIVLTYLTVLLVSYFLI